MAKTAKLKKNAKSASLHSRASRRASSPISKSLLPTTTSPTSTKPSILSTHHNAGISKRKSKSNTLSRQKRRRKEIGVEKAEVVLDRTDKKVERSLGRSRIVRERRAAWEDLNGKIEGRKRKAVSKGDEGKGGDGEMELEDVGMSLENEGIAQRGNMENVVVNVEFAEPTGLVEDEIT